MTDAVIQVVGPNQLLATDLVSTAILSQLAVVVVASGAQTQHQLLLHRAQALAQLLDQSQVILCCIARQLQT